jgi:two-component sensor histidine kinase
MAIHELAANAGKYGALSNGSGCVNIEWSLSSREAGTTFAIGWRERGGPPVSPPAKRGFGSTVISRIVMESLNAKVDLGFEPEGLTWQLECPAAEIAGSAGFPSPSTACVTGHGEAI